VQLSALYPLTFISLNSVRASLKGDRYVVAGNVRAQVLQLSDPSVFTAPAPRKLFTWIDWQSHRSRINDAAINAQEDLFVTAGDDGTVKLWRLRDGILQRTYKAHTETVNSVVFAPDGNEILTASNDHTARLIGAKGTQVLAGHTSWVRTAEFSPDGQQILTGSTDGSAILWQRSDGKILQRFEGHGGAVQAVAFSANGEWVLTASTSLARLWRISDGQMLAVFAGHQEPIHSVRFLQGDRLVVTGASDGIVRFWHRESTKSIYDFEPYAGRVLLFTKMAVTPNEKSLVTVARFQWGAGATIRVWDLQIEAITVNANPGD
jgi:WD40 repeat protein